ncbi:MAG: filamentous hemagglutinin N-terminal domain-containing protein [Xenococcus sp. (in: cyanobacteria)]
MLAPQFLTYRVGHIVITTILSINSTFLSSYTCAQIIPDETLNTQVNLVDGQQKITGGIQKETNLFHSFQEFSPTKDFGAHFDNNNYIENIFTRVTGDSASLIDGLIRTNDSASLFILNPAGIIFGSNAELKIGGSFITTTAESIIFKDGTKFSTQINQTPPLLTISIPSGLQYGKSPGVISSNNTEPLSLKVSPKNNMPPGNTIAFLGGNIELQKFSIEALSGNVEIGAVAEGEIVGLLPNVNGWQFDYGSVGKFNDIKISQQSQLNTSGQEGIVNLQGRDIFLSSGLEIINATNTDVGGAKISLLGTNQIDLQETTLSTEVVGFQPLPNLMTGKGGDIIISAKDIKIRNGSIISATTRNQLPGGNIDITAIESIEMSGIIPSLILNAVDDSGEGGNINISTGKLVITDGSRIDSSSLAEGKAGNIVVNANESIFISGSFSKDSLLFHSGLFASSGFQNFPVPNLGNSGSLTVNTPRLSIEDGGGISVSSFGQEIAGDININVEELLLDNDSQITATGTEGNINILSNNILISGTGEISVSNLGTGDAGDINIINSGELLLNDNSQITAITASGNGGSINVNGSEIVLRDDAFIATTADFDEDGGNGNGGNITIEANNLVLFDDSTINANAFEGNGGNITITAQSLLTEKNHEDVITATATSDLGGDDGNVTINTPDNNSKLETTQARVATLAGEESIYTGCDLGTDFSANKFSYIGRGGMRKGPFDPETTPELIADLGLGESEFQAAETNVNHNLNYNRKQKSLNLITEATTWIINKEGNVELIAQATNSPFSSGCLFN